MQDRTMRTKDRLSPLEWDIMETIWQLGGSPSVRDVLESMYPRGGKAYTTIQTVMNNLERKGFLRKNKIGLVNFYRPAKKRMDVVRRETNRFVDNVFGGSFQALAGYLIQSDTLTQDEIDALKNLMETKARERGDSP